MVIKKLKDLTLADIQVICNFQQKQGSCEDCKLFGWFCEEAVKYWPVNAEIELNIPDKKHIGETL